MKKILALILAGIMLFSFAACGGNTGNETTTLASGETAETPDNTEETKTVVVGYTIYEPMNYLDESGKLVGFDTELAEAVFTNLGYEVIFQEIEWSSKYTDLDSNTIDCVWNGFTANTADDDGVLPTSVAEVAVDDDASRARRNRIDERDFRRSFCGAANPKCGQCGQS